MGVPRAALAALAVAVLAGCGDDAEPGPAAPSTTSATIVVPGTAASTTVADPAGAPGLVLGLRGLGPVRVGMTVAEAGAALGRPLEPVVPPPAGECAMYAPESALDGLSFLVAGGTIARADVTAGPTATAEGLAIGQTESEAQRRYGGRLVATPHEYVVGGHYLTLVPTDPDDAGYRLVAETDGTRVTSLRAGRLPEVAFPEGCA